MDELNSIQNYLNLLSADKRDILHIHALRLETRRRRYSHPPS